MGLIKREWPTLKRDLLFNTIASSVLVPQDLRWLLYRALGVKAERSTIRPTVWVGNKNLAIGRGSSINYRVTFNTAGGITLGERCNIAMDVLFVTQSHEPGTSERRAGRSVSRPIVVGDGVWVGARAMILPGVTIGDGCVIAAGAVVTTDCESHGVYAGVPARRIKDLPV